MPRHFTAKNAINATSITIILFCFTASGAIDAEKRSIRISSTASHVTDARRWNISSASVAIGAQRSIITVSDATGAGQLNIFTAPIVGIAAG